MKRYLLPLLLAVSFLVTGLNNANATLTIGTATTYSPITLTTASGATNAEQIISFSVTATGGTDDLFTQFNFTSTFPPGTNFTNFKLLVNKTNSIVGAVNDNATFAGTGTNAMTVTTNETPNNNQGLPYDEAYAGAPLYYFIVADYTASAVGTLQVTFAKATYQTYVNYIFGGGTNSVSQVTPVGPAFTFNPPQTVVAADLTGTSLTAGPAVYYNQTSIAVAGVSLKTNYSTTTLSQITFTEGASIAAASAFFANTLLVTSANPFGTGTALTYTTASTATTITFTFSTPITLTSTVTNFYLVVDYTNAGTIGPSFTFSPTNYTTALSGAVPTGYGTNTYTPTAPVTRTYYWWGAGATTDWKNAANWTTSTNLSGVNAGTYPGATTTDVAYFDYDYWQSNSNNQTASIGAYNITIGTLNLNSAQGTSVVSLVVNNGNTLSASTLNLTNNYGNTNSLSLSGSAAGNVTTSLNISGVTTVNSQCTLTAATNSIVNFPSGSSFNFNGSFNYRVYLTITGGDVTATNCPFSFGTGNTAGANYAGQISMSSGSFTAVGGSMTMAGYQPEILVSGGTFSATSCPATLSGYNPLISVSGGTFTENTATINMSGNYSPQLQSTAGTSNWYGCTVNVSGNYNTAVMGYAVTGGTVNFGGSAAAGTATAANASTINLGTAAATGQNARIQISGGYFNLGFNSVVNIISTNSTANYQNFYNYGGVVTCASTAAINPTSTTAYISNTAATNAFTLLSDANGATYVGQLGSGAKITGQYNVQRYISTASRNYRLLASPVNGTNYTSGTAAAPNLVNTLALSQSATVASAAGTTTYPGAFVGGPTGTGGGFTATTGGPCFYLYDESIVPSTTYYAETFYSGKNIAVTKLATQYLTTQSTAVALGGTGGSASDNSTTVEVPPGNGYLLYYIGNNSNTVSSPVNATSVTNVGYINQGNVPFVRWGAAGTTTTALTNNGVSQITNPHAYAGLTMVGNPYAANIDLQKLYSDNTTASSIFTNGTNTSFSELDPTNEQFATYAFNGSMVTTSGSDASRYIGSGEGFYVTVTNAGKTLTFYEDEKTTTLPTSVMESIPVTNPVNTVDNVIPANLKMTDAVIQPAQESRSTIIAEANALLLKSTNLSKSGNNPHTAAVIAPKTPVGTIALPPVAAPASNNSNTSPNVTAVTPVALAGMHLKLVQDSVNYDECGLYFNKSYADKFDVNDAIDQDGVGGKVYLSSYSSDKVRTSINSLGDYTVSGGKRVPLFVKFSAAGLYQLQLEDIANFNKGSYSVFLLDKMLNDSLDLTLYKSYNFNYTPGTANDSTRFVLAIEHKPVPYYALLTFDGQKITQGVQLDWTVKNEFNTTKFVVQKLGANGTYAFLDSLQSDSSSLYSYVDQHPTLGSNTYRLQQTNSLGVITYSAPVTIGYNSSAPNGGLVIYPNPAKSSITVTLTTSSTVAQVATADIYNTSGKLIEHKAVSSNSFTHDVSAYQLGVYIIELKNSNGVLVGKSKFVKVN